MKNILIILFASALLLSSCEFDNFDAPESTISGKIVYQGQVLGMRTNAMSLRLYQPGFGLYTALNVSVSQDGTFSALVFDGSYKLINAPGTTQPWVLRTDTVFFELKGKATIDYEVTPYFMIKDASFVKSGANLTANCKLEKIVTTSTLQNATLYLSRTAMCDENFNEGKQQLAIAAMPDLNNVNFTVVIPQRLIDQGYCFARIGVKVSQASERLYTQVQKVTF
jgi:hypothetical protein